MYKIATLNKISPVGLKELTDNYKVVDEIEEANGILLRSYDLHSMEFSSELLAIGRAGAGVNNIPLDRCAEEGIVVFNTPGANANAVKELTIAGMFLAARNIPGGLTWASNLTENIKESVEKGKGQFAGSEIKGKTLGVIGLGAIGVMVANTASELGMEVIGYDPYITVRAAHALYSTIPVVSDLGELLPQCDFVTIHVPVNDNTKGMIDSRRIDQMKDGAIFLNFSRDTLVNDKALLQALESGKLRNYVTDFPNDEVLGKIGVIATPHLGASTAEAEDNCAVMAAKEIMAYIETGEIKNSVKNIPAMLGKITGLMADMNINIRDLTNTSKGDYAATLLDIEGAVDEAELRSALDIEGIIRVRVIK